MTNKLDVMRKWHKESWANPPSSLIETNMKYLSDDFQNYDKDGNVLMNKEAYIGMTQLLMTSFEDFRGIVDDLREENDNVIMTFHFEGKHTSDLDLSALGIGVIPASGKKIVWPESTSEFMIEDDKIVGIKPYGDSGGMEDFLEPLGVKLQSA